MITSQKASNRDSNQPKSQWQKTKRKARKVKTLKTKARE
jgi:hypothetical protein